MTSSTRPCRRTPVNKASTIGLGLLVLLPFALAVADARQNTTTPKIPESQRRVAVEVSPNRRVGDRSTLQAEPYIAAHPEDPSNLVISASEVVQGQPLVAIAKAYFTLDGGQNWSTASLPETQGGSSPGRAGIALDCWVTYGADGVAYYSTLWNPPGEDNPSIVLYRSQDNGRTWLGPVAPPGKGYDQPRTVAAPRKGDKSLYVAVVHRRMTVLRSSNGGLTFETTEIAAPNNLSHQPRNPLLLADGSLLIPFVDYPLGPKRTLSASRIYVVRSEDGGRTFGQPRFVADVPRAYPGGGSQFAVDLSNGKFRGRVYAVWDSGDFGPRFVMQGTARVREESGNHREISIAYSTDSGQTWSEPRILAQPGAGPSFFGTLAVAPDGTLGVLWIQHERYETNPLCYRTYFAASADGGETFTPPHVISDAVSCPSRPHMEKNDYFRYRHRGGDYIGLAAAADSTFHPVWTDAREGGFVIYTADIRVGQ